MISKVYGETRDYEGILGITLIFIKNARNMRKIGPREKITAYYMIRLGTHYSVYYIQCAYRLWSCVPLDGVLKGTGKGWTEFIILLIFIIYSL